MTNRKKKFKIVPLTSKLAEDWAEVFLEGMKNCQWTMKYLLKQKITKYDVTLSIIEDINSRSAQEQFLIAYYQGIPAGIIRLDSYYIPNSNKILSHFPLIKNRFQRKGIGKTLVKEGIKNTQGIEEKSIWHESWSLNQKEIDEYEAFYEKIGFKTKSNRMEMACNLESVPKKQLKKQFRIKEEISNIISDEFITLISESYKKSKDRLHQIENLGNYEIAKGFLQKTETSFDTTGFNVEYRTAYLSDQQCGGLMTATEKEKGMILEIGVLPEFRAQNIATALITNYLKEMKGKEVKEISLGVDKENIPAIKLYEKFNFKPTWQGKIMKLENWEKLGLD